VSVTVVSQHALTIRFKSVQIAEKVLNDTKPDPQCHRRFPAEHTVRPV
jgi:hypothetical protein